MKKRLHILEWTLILFWLVFALAGVALFMLYRPYGLAAFGALLVLSAVLPILFGQYRRFLARSIGRIADSMDVGQRRVLAAFPIPALTVTGEGEILYLNERFRRELGGDDRLIGQKLEAVFEGVLLRDLKRMGTMEMPFGQFRLTAYTESLPEQELYVIYFTDTTELRNVATAYENSRPGVLLLYIDNLEEVTRTLRESDRARIAGQIEAMLEEWISSPGGILRKFGSDRFMAITEKQNLDKMTENRFAILDKVRESFSDLASGVTLSIGVGQGDTWLLCEETARQALDMALARGGDQAAIKTENGYDFYGGRSRGIERRAKVRSRVMASALLNLIKDNDVVLVMGHRLSDLDSLGSAAALAAGCRRCGVRSYAVVRRQTTLALKLIERYEAAGEGDLFIEPSAALEIMSDRALLIITDTHTVPLLESGDVYEKAGTVAVIDHHRKMVNAISNTALLYQEPASSSASEMVAELLQYMGESLISRLDAEALLSGMMLDTRNFVLRTGVRTFEAAAYLRRLGADTVSVKRLFSDQLETYRTKSSLVTAAVLFHGTAITVSDEECEHMRLAAAQAADEMLSIDGTMASFVVFRIHNDVNICARSYGEFNVQLIMEAMGGGGHMTMAGTQLQGISTEEAKKQLCEKITDYIQQNNIKK